MIGAPFVILLLILLGLGAPVGIKKKSWRWLFAGMALSFLVVVLPLFFFLQLRHDTGLEGGVSAWVGGLFYHETSWRSPRWSWWQRRHCTGSRCLRQDVFQGTGAVLAIFIGAMVAGACFVFGPGMFRP